MKQALKALIHEMEYVLSCINADKVPFDGDDFHEALRLGKEALAQQCVCGEPDSAGTHRTDGPCLAPQPEQEPTNLERHERNVQKFLGTQQPKEPEQEPVAYIHRNEYNEYRLEPHDNFDIKSIPFNVDVLLFKTPQRKPLTDEQIVAIYGNDMMNYRDGDYMRFARAIEAAHGIKE